VGDFTLDKRTAGARSVVFVGTGTGLAPFAGMVKQVDHEAAQGRRTDVRYTIFHANRSRPELAYHEELQAIEAAGRIDFVYVPSVSRPTAEDHRTRGWGRDAPATSCARLRHAAQGRGGGAAGPRAGPTRPHGRGGGEGRAALAPPATSPRASLQDRALPADTVILTCGNPSSMADIKFIAESNKIRYEKEDWKLVLPART
jgi:NAD(P)H-flavin reductase